MCGGLLNRITTRVKNVQHKKKPFAFLLEVATSIIHVNLSNRVQKTVLKIKQFRSKTNSV